LQLQEPITTTIITTINRLLQAAIFMTNMATNATATNVAVIAMVTGMVTATIVMDTTTITPVHTAGLATNLLVVKQGRFYWSRLCDFF